MPLEHGYPAFEAVGIHSQFSRHVDYKSGEMFLETPDIIHVMGNRSKRMAQTLHFYSPPLTMKNYKAEELKK